MENKSWKHVLGEFVVTEASALGRRKHSKHCLFLRQWIVWSQDWRGDHVPGKSTQILLKKATRDSIGCAPFVVYQVYNDE